MRQKDIFQYSQADLDAAYDAFSQRYGDWEWLKSYRNEAGGHPRHFSHCECAFAADMLRGHNFKDILDIGSYRIFVYGLTAAYAVTSLDIRPGKALSTGEKRVVADAKRTDLPRASYDAVVSLCALEHCGLGRYGDELDWDADRRVIGEVARLLRPGGVFVFSTTITRRHPFVMFNAHRIYSREIIAERCREFECLQERFVCHKTGLFCVYDTVVAAPGEWDVYCGCWRKRSEA